MKKFADHLINLRQYKDELEAFRRLLEDKAELSEKDDILPFFKEHKQLSSQIATIIPKIFLPAKIAFEFDLFGDFKVDIAVGDPHTNTFCFIEFEDGRKESLFVANGKKYKEEFSPRLEHGFSQMIDWFFKLDDLKRSHSLEERFDKNEIHYDGLLIIGRDQYMNAAQKKRLEWRMNNVILNSKRIHCYTFDEIYAYLKRKLDYVWSVSD